MDHYVGIDVSLEASSICVINGSGKIAKLLSELEPLIGFLSRSPGLQMTRMGLEAGPLSQWLYAGLKSEGASALYCEVRWAGSRLLLTTPGVGAIVALTFVSAVDDPGRFSSSKRVGAHFGLTPKKYQSGETDVTGRIQKTGDGGVRAVLFEAAHIVLTRL